MGKKQASDYPGATRREIRAEFGRGIRRPAPMTSIAGGTNLHAASHNCTHPLPTCVWVLPWTLADNQGISLTRVGLRAFWSLGSMLMPPFFFTRSEVPGSNIQAGMQIEL